MPGVADQLVAAKLPEVFGNGLHVVDDAQPVRCQPDGDGFAGKFGGHAVAVVGDTNQASAGHPQHILEVTIKGGGNGTQCAALFGEDLGNRSVLCGMRPTGQLAATLCQPIVEIGQTGKAGPGREQPFPDVAHLILYLPLFRTRCRCAGHRLEQVMVSQCHKAGIELARLAVQDGLHHRLDIVVDHPLRHAAEEGECPVVGIEQHLLSFAWISHHEHLPAMNQPEVCHFDLLREAVDVDLLLKKIVDTMLPRTEVPVQCGPAGCLRSMGGAVDEVRHGAPLRSCNA